jgi:ubiquinone/menaquinone biosynthesis C-methylase UbiE
MLPRTLEPEAMDSPEEAQDYDAMDHSAVNRAFALDFLGVWDGANPILDFGTGTAQIPIEICRHSWTADVVGIDLARHMLEVGNRNVRRAGLTDRIQLQLCDAKSTPFADGQFAAVISNSIVHHIPEPVSVVAEMVRVTRPNGVLFVRDLVRPADEAAVAHLVATFAGDANAHQQRMFAESLRAALTIADIRDLVATLGFDPATVEQTTDRHWTWIARSRRPKVGR